MNTTSQKIEYTGQKFGPLTAVERAQRKRYWKFTCPQGHTLEHRPDILKRTLPELIRCRECERPAEPAPAPATFSKEQHASLALLIETLALAHKTALATLERLLPTVA